MTKYAIDIEVRPAFAGMASDDVIRRAAEATLVALSQPSGTGLTVVISGDEEVHILNRDYRLVDSTTDVLAFPTRKGPIFVLPAGSPENLGDVVVSAPRAIAQACDAGHSADREMALLVIHGCLHLLGMDHADEAQRLRMWSQQDRILSGLGLD